MLIEKLSIIFALDFKEGFLETVDLVVLFSDDFEVILLLDEDMIGIVDDLSQFGILVFKFLDGIVPLVDLEVEVGSGLGRGATLKNGLAMMLDLVL